MNLNNNKFKPGLYCVATPIGNMGDISFRAIEILKKSDLILCEDTRVSRKIFQKFDISKKIISNHKFNETKNLNLIFMVYSINFIIILLSFDKSMLSSNGSNLLKLLLISEINKIVVLVF